MALDQVTVSAAEQERIRLEAIIATVWEDGHFHHDCRCPSCLETRHFLASDDLAFVIHTSKVFASTRHTVT